MVPEQTSRRIWARRACFGTIALLGLTPDGVATGTKGPTTLDCGINALFMLLRLEGVPSTLDRIRSTLPLRNPAGYSMTELAIAARSLGVDVEGVRFVKGDKPLTHAAIAFLKVGNEGHFAVLRPVGTTGTMVQVIDPPSHPWIADYDRLFAAKQWTGRIIVAQGPRIARKGPLIVVALAGICLIAIAVYRRPRFPRAGAAKSVARPAGASFPS
jgi:hypothetical protein